MFKRIDHIEIVTDKLDATVAFYTDVLGFTVGARDRIERPDGSALNLVYLGLGGTTVELMNWEGVPVGPKADPEAEHLGYRMMAVEVDDMKEALGLPQDQGRRGGLGPGVPRHLRPRRDRATRTATASSYATGSRRRRFGASACMPNAPDGRFRSRFLRPRRLLLRDAALSGDARRSATGSRACRSTSSPAAPTAPSRRSTISASPSPSIPTARRSTASCRSTRSRGCCRPRNGNGSSAASSSASPRSTCCSTTFTTSRKSSRTGSLPPDLILGNAELAAADARRQNPAQGLRQYLRHRHHPRRQGRLPRARGQCPHPVRGQLRHREPAHDAALVPRPRRRYRSALGRGLRDQARRRDARDRPAPTATIR